MPTKRKQNIPGKARAQARSRTSRSSYSSARRSHAPSTVQGGFSTSGARRPKAKSAVRPSALKPGSSTAPSAPTLQGGAAGGAVMTRRNLLIGAGAIAGLAVAGGGISYAMNAMDQGSETTIEHIAVPADAVVDQGSYTLVKATDHVKLAGSYKLPYGTLVWADNDTLAACLVPTEKASPLTTVSVLNLSSGNTTTILKKAQGSDEGFEILDVRCSEKGLIWTEANAYTSAWRVYTAKLSDGSASKITKVDEADSAWCIPSLAAVDDSAFWQVSPKADGTAAKSQSALKASRFGSDAVEVPWTTKHAFATRLVAADDGVVIAPRAESTTTYYQITKIAASDRSTVDQMTLPSSMTPNFVSYGRSGFSFGFSSIYNYGDGIANLGTYTPRAAATPFQYNGLQWFRFSRTPLASPCWSGQWFVVKSTTSLCGIHFSSGSYFTLSIPSGTDDYGEHLVSSGTRSSFVGLSQIAPTDTTDKTEGHALVRVFTPIKNSVGSALSS